MRYIFVLKRIKKKRLDLLPYNFKSNPKNCIVCTRKSVTWVLNHGRKQRKQQSASTQDYNNKLPSRYCRDSILYKLQVIPELHVYKVTNSHWQSHPILHDASEITISSWSECVLPHILPPFDAWCVLTKTSQCEAVVMELSKIRQNIVPAQLFSWSAPTRFVGLLKYCFVLVLLYFINDLILHIFCWFVTLHTRCNYNSYISTYPRCTCITFTHVPTLFW